METTLQPSLQQNFRNRITVIEAVELALLGFAFWCLEVVATLSEPGANLFDQIIFLVVTEGILLGSWGIYNVYIRVARAGGRVVDIGIWVFASILTGTYTFWAWTILDVNRFLLSRLFYRGEAPVEYAWSARSKQVRKAWEQGQKSANA